MRKSWEDFTGSAGEREETGQRGKSKGRIGSAPAGPIQKNSPTVERTVGECVVGVPLAETRDAERV